MRTVTYCRRVDRCQNCPERRENKGPNKVESPQFSDNEDADEHNRKERQIAPDPPCGRLVEQERGKRNAEGSRVKQVLSADRENELGCNRPNRGKYHCSDALWIRGHHGIEDER